MFGVRELFEERKRVKKNWEDIRQESQELLSQYNPTYRKYADFLKENPIEKKVLYEAGGGQNGAWALRNLFEAFSKRSDFSEYQHIWVLHKKVMYKKLKRIYGDYENVTLWLIEDEIPLKYYKVLATAVCLFQAGLFPTHFSKRKEQFCLNIRDFKEDQKVGFEQEKNQIRAAKHLRNLLISDAVLVRDEDSLSRLDTAFRLKGIYEGEIWIADSQVQAEQILQSVLEKQGAVCKKRFDTDKKKLLFYGSGMAMNGVTEALLALLHVIDYDKYDVTLYCMVKDKVYSRKNIEKIPSNVRVIVTYGVHPVTEEEQLQMQYLRKYGLVGKAEQKLYQKCRPLMQRAVYQRFGNASFDAAIDFSGYAIWNPMLMLEIPAKKRLIWQHADIRWEFELENCGKRKRGDVTLEGLCSVYRKYDKIVSVNQILMELNKQNLGEPDTKDKFCYATNLVDEKRLKKSILETEEKTSLVDTGGRTYLVYDNEQTSVDGTIKMLPLEKKEGQFLFVTMGRMSQEKNHVNLILAFQEFLKEYPDSQLFVIGEGDLRPELQSLVLRNKIEKNVIFTGNLMNPYLLMKQCDCFVFPSLVEGQGLAVLEARILQMPIIMSNYVTAESVCVENGQYMVGTEKEDILQGLFAYAHGKVPKDYRFDLKAYNKKALEEFYQVLED